MRLSESNWAILRETEPGFWPEPEPGDDAAGALAEMPESPPPTDAEIEAMCRAQAADYGLAGDDAGVPF